MLHWTLQPLRLELKYTWAISRNSSTYKPNFIVHVRDDEGNKGMGETAPNIRYGENPELIEKQFADSAEALTNPITSFAGMSEMIGTLPLCNSLRFGIESAYAHYLCQRDRVSLHKLLHIEEPGLVQTCYSIPIIDPGHMQEFLSTNNLNRFASLKLKINKEIGLESLKALSSAYTGSIYLDPNEAFTDAEELIRFLEQIRHMNIAFVEQPMPGNLEDDYRHARQHSPFLLMADESVTDHADMQNIATQFHGVNMKLMKAGGYLNGLRIISQAREAGLKTMIGCMIESSLGIASAHALCSHINFVDLDGYLIVKNEPFGYISEQNGTLFNAKPFPA